jgi:hypothetical protein
LEALKSADLVAALRDAMRALALQIQPKVYAHGFLNP